MTEEVKTEAEKGQEQMDAANLFREEIYTDRKIGVIRCLVPVTAEGKVDESRKVIYTGEAQIMTQMGALPISFDIEADNLSRCRKLPRSRQGRRRKDHERAAGTAPRSCKQDCSSGSARLYASGRCRRQRLSYAVIWS